MDNIKHYITNRKEIALIKSIIAFILFRKSSLPHGIRQKPTNKVITLKIILKTSYYPRRNMIYTGLCSRIEHLRIIATIRQILQVLTC